jgi:Holliday junction resolvasome RuvABC ATP-dependent DNA helicase subunit
MASLWSEKYRPLHLTEIQGHNKLRNMLESAAKNKCRGLPPIILYGPPGTGKTVVIVVRYTCSDSHHVKLSLRNITN